MYEKQDSEKKPIFAQFHGYRKPTSIEEELVRNYFRKRLKAGRIAALYALSGLFYGLSIFLIYCAFIDTNVMVKIAEVFVACVLVSNSSGIVHRLLKKSVYKKILHGNYEYLVLKGRMCKSIEPWAYTLTGVNFYTDSRSVKFITPDSHVITHFFTIPKRWNMADDKCLLVWDGAKFAEVVPLSNKSSNIAVDTQYKSFSFATEPKGTVAMCEVVSEEQREQNVQMAVEIAQAVGIVLVTAFACAFCIYMAYFIAAHIAAVSML